MDTRGGQTRRRMREYRDRSCLKNFTSPLLLPPFPTLSARWAIVIPFGLPTDSASCLARNLASVRSLQLRQVRVAFGDLYTQQTTTAAFWWEGVVGRCCVSRWVPRRPYRSWRVADRGPVVGSLRPVLNIVGIKNKPIQLKFLLGSPPNEWACQLPEHCKCKKQSALHLLALYAHQLCNC